MPGPTDDDQPISFDLELGDDVDSSYTSAESPAESPRGAHKEHRGTTPAQRGSGIFRKVLADRAPRPRPKRMITELYGKTPRGGPNVAAAAEAMNRHPSTIRRWIKHGLPKRSEAGDQLRAAWQDSPSGRKASISPARRRAIESRTLAIGGTVSGNVWVATDDVRNGQARSFNYTLTADGARRMTQAVLAGDDEAAHAIFENSVQGFGSGLEIDIHDVGMKL